MRRAAGNRVNKTVWLVGCAALLASSFTAYAGEVAGTLQWVRRVELSTPVSGVVHEVKAQAGDEVKEGQVLLTLDPRGFRASVQRAEAQVTKTKAARDEAQREMERAKELYDRTLLSDHELQLAKIGFTSAQADHQSAQADLTQARLDLEYSRVSAPFNAVVLQRTAELGQTVVTHLQSVPLFTVAEVGRMLARIEVSDTELAQLHAGQEVSVHIGAASYAGKVQRLGMEPVIAAGGIAKYEADVIFRYPTSARLRAGQAVTVVLP